MSVRHNSDLSLYNWKLENYEADAKDCWSIESISRKHPRTCFLIQEIPIVYENKHRYNPTLILTENRSTKPLLYNEQNSPSTHVEEVSKYIGKQGRNQNLV
jgi:hypothetical protein